MKPGDTIPVGGRRPAGQVGEVNPQFAATDMPDYYDSEPRRLERYRVGPGKVQHPTRPLPTRGDLPPGGLQDVPWSLMGQKPYNWANDYRVVEIPTGTTPTLLVRAQGGRIEVTLHNIGDFDVWFNFSQSVAENRGEVIPGSPTAGEPLGGFWSGFLSDRIETIWAVLESAATGPVQVVVGEFGY